ncbi:MAG: flippase [Candidatus Hodarchaeota archaeon]
MLSEKATIAKNTGILVIADIVARILGTLLTITIARKLGAADLGLLAFALAFANPFGFLAGFGFKNLISRDVAKDPTKTGSYLGNIFAIKFILSACVLFAIILIINLMDYSREKVFIVSIAGFIMVLISYIEFFAAFFRAHQKVEYEAVVTILLNFLIVSSGLTILFLGYGLVPIMGVRLLVYLLCFTLGFTLVIRKLSKPSFHIRLDFCIQLIKSAIPFAVLGIVVSLNAQMPTILISFIKGDLATGWFSAAQRLVGVFGFIPMAFVGGVLPAMSKFSHKSMNESLVKTYEGTIKYLLIIALPLAVGISILADDFIIMIYGGKFIESIIVLRILVWLLVFSFLNHAFMIAFASINREKIFLKFQMLGAIVNFALNIVLISLWGHIGVSIGVVLSQIVVFALSVQALSKHFRQARILDICVKPVLAVLLMTIFLFLFRQQNVLILVPVSAVLYSFALFSLRTFNHDELSILRALFRRKLVKLEFK